MALPLAHDRASRQEDHILEGGDGSFVKFPEEYCSEHTKAKHCFHVLRSYQGRHLLSRSRTNTKPNRRDATAVETGRRACLIYQAQSGPNPKAEEA